MSGHPMPAEASINAELSNYGVSLFYDNINLVANQIAPVIPVDQNPGDYSVILPIEGKTISHETRIPYGGIATELNFKLDKATYSTEEYGKRHFESDRAAKMASASVREYRKGIELIIENLALDREAQLAEIMLTEANYYVSAEDPHWFAATTPWDGDDADPRVDIDAAARAVELHSGRVANTLLLPPVSYDVLMNCQRFVEIIQHMFGIQWLQTGMLPTPIFGLNIIKAGAIYDESARLQTPALNFLWEEAVAATGDDWAWVGYVDPSPSLKTSAMVVQFAFNNGILSYRDILTMYEDYDIFAKGTWYEGRTDYEVKLSNTRAGAVITGVKGIAS